MGPGRSLTRLLGNERTLQSSPGSGSRFILRLPAVDAPAPLPPAHGASGAGLPGRRVPVLDDDAAVRTAYANALQSLGCTVLCTASLAEAMDALPLFEPEVALVDFRLAETHNSPQAIAQLSQARPGLPALIVSADTSSAAERMRRDEVPGEGPGQRHERPARGARRELPVHGDDGFDQGCGAGRVPGQPEFPAFAEQRPGSQ